ncbi:MAG: hypothetical protein L0958_03660 [Candidatus Mariimomonas ferrooxydans]
MQQIKICPDCATEYFPHIENCADCDTALVLPEEVKKVQEGKKRLKLKALESQVVIREADNKWIEELYNVLIEYGIPCSVTADPGCKKGCSADTRQLLVSRQDAEKANELIEEYYTEVHPEARASKEMVSQGKCPACAAHVGSDAVECPDCGLTLIIVEE